MEVAAADVKQLGGSVELVDIGKQKVGGSILCIARPRTDSAWGVDKTPQVLKRSFASNTPDIFKTKKEGPDLDGKSCTWLLRLYWGKGLVALSTFLQEGELLTVTQD